MYQVERGEKREIRLDSPYLGDKSTRAKKQEARIKTRLVERLERAGWRR